MPIKLCQNCGLKVFVEEGQPIPVPFLCARCQAAMRAAQTQHERAPTLTMQNRPRPVSAPAPAPAPVPAPAPAEAGKSQLNCPACQASFSVRLPEQPARGKCPKCFQSLLVYPDGIVVIAKSSSGSGIRPAVGGSTGSGVRPPVGGSPGSGVRPAVGGSPSASRPNMPPVAAAEPRPQTRVVSAATLGRPTASRPNMTPVSEPAVGEPVTMDGPIDAPEPAAATATNPAVAAVDAEPAAPAEAAPAAAAPVETAPAEAPPKSAARIGAGRRGAARAETGVLQGDSNAKLYLTVLAVAIPALLAVVLYVMRDKAEVVDLLEKTGTPFKQGFGAMTGAAEKDAAPKKKPAEKKAEPQQKALEASKEGGTPPATPPADAPKADVPPADAPKTDSPKTETPPADAPKADAPKTDPAPAPAPDAAK
jgi:nicotinate-nucleotide--dimethylbenzimidazole phosphoribosyltransferase